MLVAHSNGIGKPVSLIAPDPESAIVGRWITVVCHEETGQVPDRCYYCYYIRRTENGFPIGPVHYPATGFVVIVEGGILRGTCDRCQSEVVDGDLK